jgi:hypothetical protein
MRDILDLDVERRGGIRGSNINLDCGISYLIPPLDGEGRRRRTKFEAVGVG